MIRYSLDADQPRWETMPECDRPKIIADELFAMVDDAIMNTPRTLQKRIGPSEIGNPCDTTIAHKLAGTPEPPRRVPPWKPTVGTAIHSWLENMITRDPLGNGRYQLEQRVNVGSINGTPIAGSCDLFDPMSGTVVDWKTKGKSVLLNHKRHGPGETYRVQAHLYGRGWKQQGATVHTVMIVFLPRDGELSDAHVWAERYDEQIAIRALERATAIDQLVQAIGLDAAISTFTPCDDRYCDWCPTQPAFRATTKPPTTAELLGIN